MTRGRRRVRAGTGHRRQRWTARRVQLRTNGVSHRRAQVASRTSKGATGWQAAIGPRPGSSAQEAPEKQRAELQYLAAVKNFEVGVRYFQKGNYQKSKEIFEKLAGGPTQEVANRAQVYLRMCEQKLSRTASGPKGAADLYDLGVAQLNARDLELAVEHLSKALRSGPKQEHVRYALAAAHALMRNVEAALEHLRVAVELRPANRFLAGEDEDFRSLADDPRFQRLIQSGVT